MIERIELSKEQIARRAYDLYTQRGCKPGKDVEDWVRAEKELGAESDITSAKSRAGHTGQFN